MIGIPQVIPNWPTAVVAIVLLIVAGAVLWKVLDVFFND